MRRSPAEVGRLFKARRNAKKLKQTDLGPTPKTISAIERGEVGPKTRSPAPYAASLGWPPDAWQRLLDGDDPATLSDESPLARTVPSDLADLLGVGGQVVQDELDEIKARLDKLEAPANVTALNPRQRSPKANPDYCVETARAASRDDERPDETRPTGRRVNRPSPPDEGPDPTEFYDIPPDEGDSL